MVFRGALQDGTLAVLADYRLQGCFAGFASGEIGESIFVEFGENGGGRAGAGARFGGGGARGLGDYNQMAEGVSTVTQW